MGGAGVGRFAVSGRQADLFAYSPFCAALSLSLVRCCYLIRKRGGTIAMCTVFVSSFSRHPLAIDDEAAIIHLSAMRCDLPEAATITAMTAIAAAAVAMMARGGWRERDE